MKKYILFLIISGVSTMATMSQNLCNMYEKKECPLSESVVDFKYDTQSKSALFAKGQVSSFNVVAYKNQEYRIAVCGDEMFEEPITFKIYEKVKEVMKPGDEYASGSEGGDEYSDYSSDASSSYADDESGANAKAGYNGPKFRVRKELIYDNTEDEMAQEIEFTVLTSKSLIIEVKTPGEDPNAGRKLKINQTGCVGVLVEHAASPKSGF